MRELLTAINTTFAADSALSVRFPNGAYLTKAPDKSALPLCVVSPITTDPQYNTCPHFLNVYTIQFSVFATTAGECVLAADEITNAFDFVPLSLATSQSVSVRRNGVHGPMTEDEKVFNIYVEYQFWVGENLPR